jgi:hypothetical protein
VEAPAKSEEESELADSPADDEGQPRRGFFARLKQGLKKTNQLLFTDVRDLFKGEGRLVDDAFLEELRRILIRTDMGPQAAAENIDEVRTQFRARVVQMDDILNVVKVKLKQLMAQDEAPLKLAASGPTVIMVCGVTVLISILEKKGGMDLFTTLLARFARRIRVDRPFTRRMRPTLWIACYHSLGQVMSWSFSATAASRAFTKRFCHGWARPDEAIGVFAADLGCPMCVMQRFDDHRISGKRSYGPP